MTHSSSLRTNVLPLLAGLTLIFHAYPFLLHGIDSQLPHAVALGRIGMAAIFIILIAGGITLQFTKDWREPYDAARKMVAVLLSVPLLSMIALGILEGQALTIALSATLLPCTIFAIWREDPPIAKKAAQRDMVSIFAGLAAASLPLAALFTHGTSPNDDLVYVLSLLSGVIGVGLLVAQAKNVPEKVSQTLRVLIGLIFASLALFSYSPDRYLVATGAIPVVIALLLHPHIKALRTEYYAQQKKNGLTPNEVAGFMRIDERAAWIASHVVLVIAFLYEPFITSPILLFVTTSVVSFQFVIFYRLMNPARDSLGRYNLQTNFNVIGIAFYAHSTGGFASIHAMYMPFMIFASIGALTQKGLRRQTALVFSFFVIEGILSAFKGQLTAEIFFTRALPLSFVTLLSHGFTTGMVAARGEINEKLRVSNESLLLSKKRDDALFESLAEAIFVCDQEGKIVQTNHSADELIGKAVKSEGKKPDDVLKVTREDGMSFAFEALLDAARNGRSSTLPSDIFMQHPGGRQRYISGYSTPFSLEEGSHSGAIITIRDITLIHEAEKVKSDFLSIAAHQIRTPLTNIRWNLELAKEYNDDENLDGNGKKLNFVTEAHGSALRLIELVRSILSAARLESGRVPFKPEPLDLKSLLTQVFASQEGAAREKNVKTVNEISDLPKINLDPVLTREVFVNLVSNAIRYGKTGGYVKASAKEAGSSIIVTIKDNGIGIPKDQQKKIFAKFFRAKNAISQTNSGTGLGLFLARYIVNAWNGDITFESASNKGTSFHVSIPKSGMSEKAGTITLHA